jgi:predicted dehydrogenase
MEQLRVAAIGNGGIFSIAHAPAWQKVEAAEIVATCDIDAALAEQASASFPGARSFTDIDEMFRQVAFDIVDICTPHDSHASLSIKALEAGKHVIVEKPIALSLDEAASVLECVRRTGQQLFVAHTRRFDRRWVEVKQLLDSGRIGEPVAGSWHERSWAGFPSDSWRWRPQNGGILADLGVHVADLFAWFFEARPREVYARTQLVRPEARDYKTADLAVAQVTYGDNKQALIELSWAHPPGHAPFYSSLELIGTEGKIRLSDQDASPMIVVKGEQVDIPRYSPLLSTFPSAFTRELEHFVDCVTRGTESRITPLDAYWATASAIAALESAETGRAVSLEELPE